MKNTILWGALFTLACSQIQAETIQLNTQAQTTDAATSVNDSRATIIQAANSPTTPTSVQAPPATTQQPSQNVQTIPAVATTQTPPPAPVINCDYKIPAEMKSIDKSLVLTWSEKATTQAFDFDPTTLDVQMQKLQACFTDQGWTGFNSALQKSGNLEAIKSQKLNVSSQLDGLAQITDVKDNQWKITLPLQVVYQNNKEKVTQLLNVNLTVGRKITGDLGITQMIATPRASVTLNKANEPINTGTASDTNATTPSTVNPTNPQQPLNNTAAPTH